MTGMEGEMYKKIENGKKRERGRNTKTYCTDIDREAEREGEEKKKGGGGGGLMTVCL